MKFNFFRSTIKVTQNSDNLFFFFNFFFKIMTTRQVIFIYCNKPVNVTINQNSTFGDVFPRIKDILNLTEDISNYVILNIPNKNFRPTDLVIPRMANVPQDFCYYIATKREYQVVNEFCSSILQNVSIESFRLPLNVPLFLAKMHLMHQMVNHILDENDSVEILSIIPWDQFGDAQDKALIEAATKWFHESYFKYQDKPVCHVCGKETTKEKFDARPTAQEAEDGAYTVWRYKCPECEAITRFPRYLSTRKINETKTGQSIESTVLLGCILNALGFQPRVVCNMEYDRMWLEVYVDALETFIHVDPTEGVVDAPYIYEQWGRKCRWVVAVGAHDCTDVTARYTRNAEEVIEGRNQIFPEESYQQIIGLRNSTWKYNADSELVEQETEHQSNDKIFCEPRELNELEKQPQKVGSE